MSEGAAGKIEEDLELVAHGGLRAREEAISRLLAGSTEERLDVLLEQVAVGGFARRNAALEVLGRIGAEAWPELEDRLPHLSDQTRMFLAPILAEYPDDRVLERLHLWLESDDPNLVAAVCEALGRMGDRRSVPALATIVRSDPWMAAPAIDAVGHIGGPEALPLLEEALAEEEYRPFAVGALGELGDPAAWPALAAAVREEPTFAAVALDHLEPLLRQLDADAIAAEATPRSVWLPAAREGLERDGSFYASVRLLGALRDAGSVPRLLERYLNDGEEEAIPAELARIPGARGFLRERLTEQLSDEECRRAVRLIFELLPEATEVVLDYLAHPSAAVRLEVVVYLGRLGSFGVRALTEMLSDPDELVRRTAFQALKARWSSRDAVETIDAALDVESVPEDMLERLALEGPEVVVERISGHLRGLEGRRGRSEDRLHVRLEAREHPDQVMQEVLSRGDGEAVELDAVPVIAALDSDDAARWLAEVAVVGREGVRYVAAESLGNHPRAGVVEFERLLRESTDPAVLAVAAAWAAEHGTDAAALRPVLEGLPVQTVPETEREILRALRVLAPGRQQRRFERSLRAEPWFLQLEAVRGLSGSGGGREEVPEQIHPLVREVLEDQG